jgi:hypothetical protein
MSDVGASTEPFEPSLFAVASPNFVWAYPRLNMVC